ncbi:MAG TPA: DUF4450 domain-containing protein [Lacunisphaera sp.]
MLGSSLAFAQPAAVRLTPNLESNIDRPLRYHPDGADFVIENGTEFFNRPLYGGNTAFRVDGGDKPEFVLYLPGRGGNLRIGIHGTTGAKWLHDASAITTRYRPGELLYEIHDPLLGDLGVLRVAAIAAHQTEAFFVRVEAEDVAPGTELVWAYGGVNGQRGSRDGDIGTERVPISEWFQLQPGFAKDNAIELVGDHFTLRAKTATILGLMPTGSQLHVGDAAHWNDLSTLLSAVFIRAPDHPVVVGRTPLANGTPLFLGLQRVPTGSAAAGELDTYAEAGGKTEPVGASLDNARGRQQAAPLQMTAADLPRLFTEAEQHFAALRQQVLVVTPDPFINAAVGALNVAADAVWDEPQQAIMHGAIAWRTRLLGWRGPYALDALGWHDRARKHFESWATHQNLSPIPEKLPSADEKSNLARNEAGLHSNGDISNSHYDMNLVFIDALFRHLLWTGDVEFAQKMWPVIERHLAWERRLFRREFTTASGEKLTLYEAYAAIWASDDLQYSGGGTAHASAYNAWHNRMAARIALLAKVDPAPFNREADLIERGMRELLWLNDHFAESKDLLGRQLAHPSAALWTFYHTMDSQVPTPREASVMARQVIASLPRLPVRGAGVPSGLSMFATSDWMPYTWSLNNVVMGENVHTSLALWQAGRPEEAFQLLKSALVASMFMGISPGNVGSMNYLDVYRRESQRDFADGSGVSSRAIVEGLFGLQPDAFRGELTIAPRFPREWTHAALTHPALEMSFNRDGATDSYTINASGLKFPKLRLVLSSKVAPRRVAMKGDDFQGPMNVNRGPEDTVILSWPATRTPLTINIEWPANAIPSAPPAPALAVASRSAPVKGSEQPDAITGKIEPLDLTPQFNDRVTALFQKGKYLSPRSPFVSLALPSQGIGYWAGHVNASAEIDDTGLRAITAKNGGKLPLPNGVVFATPGPGNARNILFTSQWDNYPREATVPLSGQAHRLHLLMAGSTNAMQSRLDNGEVIVTYADGSTSRLALRNPETWWPIEQDYFIDDYQFRIDGPLPTRVDLKTGAVRVLDAATFKGRGGIIPGGAATVLALALDPQKELKSLTVRALANDVVIGLMAATLER